MNRLAQKPADACQWASPLVSEFCSVLRPEISCAGMEIKAHIHQASFTMVKWDAEEEDALWGATSGK